jgi:hypothetical protein
VIFSPEGHLDVAALQNKLGSWPNGRKLTLGFLVYQLPTQFLWGCDHERKALGSPLPDARLHPMGAYGVHDQRHKGSAMPGALSQQELDSDDGREHAVTPRGLAGLLTRADDGFWLQLGRPRCLPSAQHGGDTGYHRSTSCMCGDHRPSHTGATMVDQQQLRPYQLTTYP